jgi:hypothetical protein
MGSAGSITSRADQFTGSQALEHTRSTAQYSTNGAQWAGSGLSSDILRQMRYLLRGEVGSAILSMVVGWTASGGATVAAAAQQPVAAAPSPQQSAATTPAPPQTPEGLKPAGFGIRFSTDGAPEEAFHEVGKAKAPPISAKTVYVFKKGGSWVSVAKFGAKDERDRQFSKFKGIWPTASTIPDLSSWCPTPKTISGETKNMAEQFDCGP